MCIRDSFYFISSSSPFHPLSISSHLFSFHPSTSLLSIHSFIHSFHFISLIKFFFRQLKVSHAAGRLHYSSCSYLTILQPFSLSAAFCTCTRNTVCLKKRYTDQNHQIQGGKSCGGNKVNKRLVANYQKPNQTRI